METDDIDILILRNRLLLAVAREARRAFQETRFRLCDTWRIALEVRQRASSSRLRSQSVRASAGRTEDQRAYGRQN